MRKQRHVRNSVIVAGALVMSLALPVTALLSREEQQQLPEVRSVEFAASIPAASMAVSPMSREIIPSNDHTSQTLSMVIVGSLLIGVGSAIRRSV
jgi:hypothetical protein